MSIDYVETVVDPNKQEIWEFEEWEQDEWTEQTLAEIAFAKAMNVYYVLEPNKLRGDVAGYRVRRAPNGLTLGRVDIHRSQIMAPTRNSMDANESAVFS
jgi:hypothetical protein